jgi:fatty-acyl-CoA synthase
MRAEVARLRQPIEATSLGDLVLRAAAQRPNSIAAAFLGERFTAAELLQRSVATAQSLRALGVGPSDSVGILMPNVGEFLPTLFGVALLGAVAVTMNVRYRTSELSYVVGHSGMKVLLTTDRIAEHVDFAERLSEAFPDLLQSDPAVPLGLAGAPNLRTVVILGTGASSPGFVDRESFERLGALEYEDDDDVMRISAGVGLHDPAILMYTSGTTADPKGCVLSHEALVRTAIAQVERFRMTSDDVFWTPLPLFHIASILALLNSLWSGARFVSAPHFEAGAAIRQIEDEGATILYPTFPTIAQAMIEHPSFADLDCERVRLFNHVGPVELQRQVQAAFGNAKQVQSYGATEVSGVISVHDPDDPADTRAETCGRPWIGTEVRIADPDTGAERSAGVQGEILVRGFGRFTEYYGDPVRTAEAIDADGWFHSGDIGSIEPGGWLRFHGRYKDMLKVGGENVAAIEVENFLCTHPSIQLAQVVGVPDDRLVEVVAAFVQTAAGEPLSAEDVIDYCAGAIASFKIPRHVRFVEDWPMSATKIQKYALREQLLAELQDWDASAADVAGPSHQGLRP